MGTAWGLRGDGSVTKGVSVGKVYCEQVCVGKFQLEQVFPSVDMANCVGIETGYIKMRGDYKYTSKWVGIAVVLRGD